ncbi:MAG: hypothetical protein LBV34_17375 [Nocardiopsaceae bacterium]|jgi:hypothetical protein|nr:hypothetical protein [Nocardiopsaceae bacterium]
MLKRVMVVVLLGCVGLVVGVMVTSLGGPSYNASGEISLPAHSRESAADLVAMVKGQHPGVRVIPAGSRTIYVSVNGSLNGSANAYAAAVRELLGHVHGKVDAIGRAGHALISTTLGNPVHYGAVGLLAGLSAALGFLVPPKSRLTSVR